MRLWSTSEKSPAIHSVAGRPAILIPLPSAADDHQTANARELAAVGGARSIRQANFTPQELAKQMQKLALDPEALINAARRAHGVGRPRAAEDLADLVEQIGLNPIMQPIPVENLELRPLKGAFA